METIKGLQLLNKAALVTGASRGIGRAAALVLAAEGADVAINFKEREKDAEALKKEIHLMGRRAFIIKADVSKKQEVEKMVSETLNTFGRIDVLVNSAGILPRSAVKDMPEEVWDRTIDTNLKGVFLCCQAVLKPMMEQKSGKIVNMTSGRGVAGQEKGAHYSASKGGIIGFTKSLALEMAPYGINVNAIAPGAMDTDMWRASKTEDEIKEKLKTPRMPRGVGKPEDVMGTVVFLTTDASRYITGQIIFMKTP